MSRIPLFSPKESILLYKNSEWVCFLEPVAHLSTQVEWVKHVKLINPFLVRSNKYEIGYSIIGNNPMGGINKS